MKKYFLVFKNSIQKAIIYRFNTFVGLLVQILAFGLIYYLWTSIYINGGQIGSYSLQDIISYYALAIMLSVVMRGGFVAWIIGEDIQQGVITNYLTKPFSYFWYRIFDALGNIFYRLFVYLLAFLAIFLFVYKYMSFSLNVETIFYFICFVFFGIIINLIFFYIIGIAGLWLGTIQGFVFSILMIVNFLSGTIVPLDLLPKYIININNFLPFKYIMYYPISIYTGSIELKLSLFIGPILWIIILYILSILIFNKGIKKYEGYGA